MLNRLAGPRPKHGALAIVFVLLLAWFAVRNPYFLPSTLEFTSEAAPGTEARLFWDSGEGFNGREYVEPVAKGDKAEKGTFEYRFPLPQIGLRALKLSFTSAPRPFDRVGMRSKNGVVRLSATRVDAQTYLVSAADLGNRGFHPFMLTVQAILALLLTWLIGRLWDYLAPRRRNGLRSILSDAFVSRERYVFWSMFAGLVIVYGVWLLGQWPGLMSVDSFHFTWREIKTLQLSGVTPWMYNAYVLALTQFADTPAVVPIFQITMTSLLGSWLFFAAYRHGAAKWLVALSYLCFATSIPVGLYNLVLWKDIPFCLTMLAWGGLLYFMAYRRTYHGETLPFRLSTLVVLAASLVFLATVRHNGIIFLAAIPAILVVFRLMPKRNLIQFIALTAVGFCGLSLATPHLLVGSQEDVKTFFAKTYRVSPLSAIYTSKHFYSPNYEQDWAVINKWIPQAELKEVYTPTQQADVNGMMIQRWMALEPKDRDYLNHLYIERSLQNPHIFLADRAAMFLGAMGFANNVFIVTNELYNEGDRSAWRPIESYKLHLAKPVPFLYDKVRILVEKALTPGGKRALIYNSLPAFLLLTAVLLAYAFTPVSSLFAFIFLYNLPFLFLVLSTCEWRYFYFLVLASYFVLPLVSAERSARRKRSHVSEGLPAEPAPALR